MPVEISNSHLLPECALYRQQHLFRGMIQVDGDVVPGRSALPRHDLRVAFGLRSRRASQIDDQIRRIRVPRSFGRIAGVAALALGESVIQDDHAAAAGAESLPTRRTAVSRSTVQDQNIQLPGQPGRDPIHQGRAFVLVFALEHDHEAAARECPPGNDQRAEDSPVKSHRQPDDHAYPSSHNSAGRGIRAIRAERRNGPSLQGPEEAVRRLAAHYVQKEASGLLPQKTLRQLRQPVRIRAGREPAKVGTRQGIHAGPSQPPCHLIDRMAGWLGRPCMDALARSDLRWLAARTDPHRLAELSEGLLGKEATRLLLDIVSGEPSYRLLRALKRRAIPPLSAYRTYTPAGAVVRRGIRMVVGLAVALNRRILRSLVIPGRTLSSGGLVIVFEGEDENERATLVDRIAAWLTWKLDVLVLHGRPRNSRATRRKAFRARSRGMIVLYDGFPEGQRRDTGNAPERAWDADPPDLVINLRRAPRPEPEGHTEVVTREGRPTW